MSLKLFSWLRMLALRLKSVVLRNQTPNNSHIQSLAANNTRRSKSRPNLTANEVSNDADQWPNRAIKEDILWKHPFPDDTHMWKFMQQVNQKYGNTFHTYSELHSWGNENLPKLWDEIWSYCKIRHSAPYHRVVVDAETMWPRSAWFEGARLNFAENLLFPIPAVDESDIAIIAVDETSRETVTWKELRERVRFCQAGMKSMNIKVGDRIAGYVANHTNALVTMLAATSLGAIWTAVSPDIGVTGALDRLTQISPSLLFTDNVLIYKGKSHAILLKVKEISKSLPSLRATVVFMTARSESTVIDSTSGRNTILTYDEFTSATAVPAQMNFIQLPAEHPVYILYSSGTTGAPKCIIHGAIGTLIQHKKEHILHSDIRPGDRFCQITTCMWMMWHWLVSGLASGATVVLYNGSPFHYLSPTGESIMDDLAMPKLIEELRINQFGTSAKYLSILEQKEVMPREAGISLGTLKAVYSTGSPLAPSTFRYVYRAFPQINLGSISGGTDIICNFGAPCPLQPVCAGEIQVVGLGLCVQAWDADGNDVSGTGSPAELVCTKAFPSQPIGFWGPEGRKRYKSSYFERFGTNLVWAHGDFIRFNTQTGGLIMLGRSDGVLNPCGVRFGSAEIYNLLQNHFAHAVEDSLCIGRQREYETDETVILFLKMREGEEFNNRLASSIRDVVRIELSPRHVPGLIDQCLEIPTTPNGKKVEILIKKILSGEKVQTDYSGNVVNPDCLDWYREWARRQ